MLCPGMGAGLVRNVTLTVNFEDYVSEGDNHGKKKYVLILTHSYDNPHRVAGALQLATNMKALDIDLDFF